MAIISFETKMEENEVSSYNLVAAYPDVEVEIKDFTVFWNVELDCKSYGVVGFITNVTNIKGNIDIYPNGKYNDQDEEQEPEELILVFKPYYKDLDNYLLVTVRSLHRTFELKEVLEMSISGDQLYPTSLELDFASKTYTIS